MGLNQLHFSWPWNRAAKKKGPKTVNIFWGFFFIVNFCLGTGFLGIPYSFFYSGYLAAVPTFIFISIVNWINANYLLEVMARAQAVDSFNKSQKLSGTDSEGTDSEEERKKLACFSSDSSMDHPKFEITLKRKFEIAELCEVFYNKYIKYIYLVVLSIYGFLTCWSFSTVAASAWAINFPFHHLGSAEVCPQDAFLHRALPAGGCLYAYYICLTVFAAVVVTLSLLDLKEQAFVQVTLGFLRFITVAVILVYCIVRLAMGGDACREDLHMTNLTIPINVVDIRSIVLEFDPRGWVVAVPVITFAFLFHTSISALTHPIKQKEYLHWLLMILFFAAGVCYLGLGIIVPLWFRVSIQETVTLNWAILTGSGNPLGLRILSYYIILFPSVDVISAFPLVNHVSFNNIYMFITGRDTSLKPKYKYDWILKLVLKIVIAILPILAAFGVANLIYVLKYAGLAGFMCFLFPFLLQLKSISVCKKKFSAFHISLSGSHSEEKDSEEEDTKSNGDISPGLTKESGSLLQAKDLKWVEKQALYMTPYSNILISHPVSVYIVGAIGGVLFVLAVASLFVHPKKLTCDMLVEVF